MIKITGHLLFLDEHGNHIEESKTFKKWGLRAKIYRFKMKFLYDWVETEYENN